MNIAIIIQARVDSERFPKKVLKLIDEEPVLLHVINQCKKTGLKIIIATTKRKIDDPIVKIAKKACVKISRGSKNDVLDRYYQTAKKFDLKWIIRVTADCPFIDPNESRKVVKYLINHNVDYVSLDEKTYPDGLDTEGFTFKSLESAWKHSKLKSEREHVTPYIKNQKNNFKQKIISYKKDLSRFRWTIDYEDDLKFSKFIFKNLKNKNMVSLKNILKVLNENPELTKINSSHKRNEGYKKSLKKDKQVTVL